MQVSIRELKAHLSLYLGKSRQGIPLEITSHRRVVARITGIPEGSDSSMSALIARGAAQWSGGKPAGAQLILAEGGTSVSGMVLQDRG